MALMEGLIIGGLVGGGYYYYDNYIANDTQSKKQEVRKVQRPAIMDSEFYPVSSTPVQRVPQQRTQAKEKPQPQRFISYQTQAYYPTESYKKADSCLNPDYVYDYSTHSYVSVCLPY